jgi:hypothetical protein
LAGDNVDVILARAFNSGGTKGAEMGFKPSIERRWPEFVLTVAIVIASQLLFGSYVFGVVSLVLAIIWLGAILFERQNAPKAGIEGFAALLSVIALLLAGYWYFIERKGYPKLNVEPALQAWPVGEGAMLVWGSLKLTNVGNMALQFGKHDDITVQIGQVAPLAGARSMSMLAAMKAKRATKRFDLVQTENWPSRATFVGAVPTTIEAGEAENLYFRTIIPCVDNAILSITAIVPKDLHLVGGGLASSDKLSWISQSLVETKAKCSNRKVSL